MCLRLVNSIHETGMWNACLVGTRRSKLSQVEQKEYDVSKFS